MARARQPAAVLELPVSYSNVNIGDETVSVGVKVHRANLRPTQADSQLCGKRLHGRLLARSGGAQAEQPSISGMEADVELEGTFDVHSFRVTPKFISFGCTFAIESIRIETMAHFAKREGKLCVYEVADIPEDVKEQKPKRKKGDDEEEADDE